MSTKSDGSVVAAVLALGVGGVMLFAALTFVGVLVGGWYIALLWSWFVVPVFALPALSLPQAYGLSLVLRALRPNPLDYARRKEENWWLPIVTNTTAFALLLGMSYLVHLWVEAS